MDSPFAHELRVAFAALERAAKISQAVMARSDKGTVSKEDLSPVTVADFAVQALLTATFHATFPGDGFVGEESSAKLRESPALLQRVWDVLVETAGAASSSSLCAIPESKEQMCDMIDWCCTGAGSGGDGEGEKSDDGSGFSGARRSRKSRRTWVFDPIDGTANFVCGELYAINIALLKDYSPHGPGGKQVQVLGVVACPNLAVGTQAPVTNSSVDPDGAGCIVFAARGYGTYVRSLFPRQGEGSEPAIQRVPLIAQTEVVDKATVASSSGLDEVHDAAMARLGLSARRPDDSDVYPWVVQYVVLGLGLADVMFWAYADRKQLAKIWDHAGAMLLYEEVGGKITDFDGLDINLTEVGGRTLAANYGIVAAPRHLHHQVLQAVQDAMREKRPDLVMD
ncbi:3',5'-bisphosphate nucleotidase [Lasiosphaeria ovina]|uniref:3',5'-bisphosphate nucleotidase n=1 Tax=Lasiosphaeria ovina TaxID=92902 RepID=A0AAE0JXL1_9PEZI|nr:3',5'-bisphosphate nucleotidase [Lasiosphaeria ovina]